MQKNSVDFYYVSYKYNFHNLLPAHTLWLPLTPTLPLTLPRQPPEWIALLRLNKKTQQIPKLILGKVRASPACLHWNRQGISSILFYFFLFIFFSNVMHGIYLLLRSFRLFFNDNKTRNVSKVHGCPRPALWVNNWPISNLAIILNIFILNVNKPL